MPKINILDKSIFNLISAGEVVERPASAIKEMVENSIDAGAKTITIEIENGGIDKIKIVDDGHGMGEKDLARAFMPHATSKITTADDLTSIGTLGFRGEALSSIAAVSHISMISKLKNEESGYRIDIIGGEIQKIEPSPAVDGTVIIMENLFFNVPARAKFLKKPKQEESEVTNYISRLILSNPDVAFKYLADGKTVFQSSGKGLFDAIYSIYGKGVVDNLLEVNAKTNDFHLTGFIGKPTYSKPNRTYQTLVVNGRYVINHQISVAVFKAFESFLMRSQFPFFVLHLQVALDKVDVNVHPNKLEIKFEQSAPIFGFVLNAISEILYDTKFVKNINNFESVDNVLSKSKSSNDINNDTNKDMLNNNIFTKVENANTQPNSNLLVDNIAPEIKVVQGDGASYQKQFNENLNSLSYFLSNKDESDQLKQDESMLYNLTEFATNKQTFVQEKIIDTISRQDIVFVGKVFGTYLITQKENSIYLIDQHAAHERILYDEFTNNVAKQEVHSQNLMIPHMLDLNVVEKDFLENNLELLVSFGFEIEEFGVSSYKISAVPLVLEDIDLTNFFNEFLKELSVNSTLKKTDILKEYLAKCACKNAVKANDDLTDFEVEKLISDLETTKTLLCPHGRPIIIEITKKEIEKWFKRIV